MNKLLYFFATVIMLINYGVANEIPYLIKEEITLKAENEYSIRNWLDTTTLRYRIVEINEAALIGDSFTVTIDLFEDVSFNATLKKKITKRGVSWIGDNVKDSEGNTVYLRLAKNNGKLRGMIRFLNKIFEIKWVSKGLYAIIEIDPASFVEDAPAITVEGGKK